MSPTRRRAWRPGLASVAAAALLAACGGGGGSDPVPPALGCSVPEQNQWLRSYMGEWYFWYAVSPSPDPAGFTTLASYFDALLFPGGTADFPARDRYSAYETTESFNRFFGDGQTLGYGLAVAGLEVRGKPNDPLRVRYIEPQSDAQAAGILRGDEVLSINGRSASDIIAADDFSSLVADAEGQQITVVLRRNGVDRSVTLTAKVFSLTPVAGASVVTTPLGRRMGYVRVQNMISQALTPLDQAFAQFRAQGVAEVALDLRYNGGGLVSVGRTVASYVGGPRSAGRDYARLRYNDKRAAINDQTYTFDNPAAALGLARVYVLVGPRTCSAAEQVVNGLKPFVDVVAIGDTTCGKPVGFLPTPQCGNTFSVVNFESVNAAGFGRYFDGLAATCRVADDLTRPLGSPDEGLLDAARRHADSGACPISAERPRPLAAGRDGRPDRAWVEPGERRGMLGDR